MNLLPNVKVTRVLAPVAAGTTDQESTAVDMTGFDGVLFLASFGTLTSGAVTSINAAQSSDNSSFADLEGTKITVTQSTDSDKDAVLDVLFPTDRYVRCHVDRATANAVINGVWAFQYGPAVKPVTQPSGILGSEYHASPAEGTA